LRTSKIEGRIAAKENKSVGRNVMRLLGKLGLAAAACLLWAGSAAADTTVKWLHIEANPAQVKIWEEVARAYEAQHPGVKVEMQFLENEAYKAKLPTLLQSRERPHIIYSWAGGVLKAQNDAGVLEDVTASVAGYKDNLAAGAVATGSHRGRRPAPVRENVRRVGAAHAPACCESSGPVIRFVSAHVAAQICRP
jgi:hypothetical protein